MLVTEAAESFRGEWNAFVQASPQGSFLQSWAWGEFQLSAGFPVLRLLARADTGTEIEAVGLWARRSLPLRRFFLAAPWGPVFAPAERRSLATVDVLQGFAGALREALGSGGVFARIEPRLEAAAAVQRELQAAAFVPGARSIQPRSTRVVDLEKSEDDLLRSMHPKTRYNIRLARRHHVVVDDETFENGLRHFLNFARETERKGTFHYHADEYYRVMLKTLAPIRMVQILVARHEGLPLTAHLLVRYGDTVTYAHGASGSPHKHVMAPYLLQWEGMLRAKAQGAKRYDFFGIAPPHSSATHAWAGVTRFKAGFGGTEEHYVGAADLVTDPTFYRLYEAGRSLRSLLR